MNTLREFNSGDCVKDEQGFYMHHGCKMRARSGGGRIWVCRVNPTGGEKPKGYGVYVLPKHKDGTPFAKHVAVRDGFRDSRSARIWANVNYPD